MKRLASLAALGLTLAAATPAAAQSSSLVLYNAGGLKLMQAIVDDFTKKNPGIKVEVINGGVGELITRIRAEAARARGDVYFAASSDAYDFALDNFESYKSTEDAAFDRKTVQKDNKYYGFSQPLQAFVINTKMMPVEKAPKSWADLAKPEYKGKVLMAQPAQSGSAYSQMYQIVGLHGWDVMAKVIENGTFVTSSKLAYANVGTGEFPIGITGEFNVLTMKDEGQPVAAIYPSEGTGLTMDGNGIIKGAPNLANAKKFIDYANSKAAHEILVKIDNRRSVRADVPAPPGLPSTTEIKVVPYDSVAAAGKKKEYLERFDKIFSAK
jgi:iron(III) transport system substrate-binding protein